jgi:hypothetical protein
MQFPESKPVAGAFVAVGFSVASRCNLIKTAGCRGACYKGQVTLFIKK